jgi:2,4-dienoyl-CoA reductase-like NADH-dependent reductase (Old Yellow Enzyme family)
MTASSTSAEVLASSLLINQMQIKNRIVLGPMAVLRPTEDGRPSEQTIAFLARRAKRGFARPTGSPRAIFAEGAEPHPTVGPVKRDAPVDAEYIIYTSIICLSMIE